MTEVKLEKTTPSLAEALIAFQAEVPAITKSKTVNVKTRTGSYSFSYAPYEVIMEQIKPLLSKHGLSIVQPLQATQDGRQFVSTILTHLSGEQIDSLAIVPLDGKSMQEIGSAITYMRRYALSSILGLVTDEDDDANIADGNEAEVTKSEDRKITQSETDVLKDKAALVGKNLDDVIQSEVGDIPLDALTEPQARKVWTALNKTENVQ
jgi:hypothetical protein